MKKTDKYKELFTKEYLMGPNSVVLLEEMLEKYPLEQGIRVLDLGCGKGLTSLFLAKEANVNVFATDLWISATENHLHFKEWQVSDKVIPIHADANDLPFADEYFDAAWRGWFASKHEYALHDEKYFAKGVGQYLSTVGLVIRKR